MFIGAYPNGLENSHGYFSQFMDVIFIWAERLNGFDSPTIHSPLRDHSHDYTANNAL